MLVQALTYNQTEARIGRGRIINKDHKKSRGRNLCRKLSENQL